MISVELDKQIIDCYLSNTCSIKQVCHNFGVSLTKFNNTLKRHNIARRPLRKVPSEEHKLKIAASLRKAHTEGRHPGWTAVNSKNEDSYPERCFNQFLDADPMFSGLTILSKVPVRRYVLDFVIADYKINIEVDGQFHYRDQWTINKDRVRDATLVADGWRVFRVSWVMFRDNREQVASDLAAFLESSLATAVHYGAMDVASSKGQPKHSAYCSCGNLMYKTSTNCRKCSDRIRPRPIKITASKNELIDLLSTHSLSSIGRLYNVSAKAVESRCRRDGIDYRSIWASR